MLKVYVFDASWCPTRSAGIRRVWRLGIWAAPQPSRALHDVQMPPPSHHPIPIDHPRTFLTRQGLPTRISAPPKALQRRALYRSELLLLWQGANGELQWHPTVSSGLLRNIGTPMAFHCGRLGMSDRLLPRNCNPSLPAPSLAFEVDGSTAHLNIIVILPLPPLFPPHPCDQSSRLKDHRHQATEK